MEIEMDVDADVRAALRKYPFYDFDRSRVAVRAYYLSERVADPFHNWLEAECLETVEQSMSALTIPTTSRQFFSEYEQVDHTRFLTNEPRRKEYRGERGSARRCSVCGKTAPAVKFKTQPHLLPACTGNRFLFTAEECDACNLGSGKETEDSLGKMLAPIRALSRIQTREKPSTTLKIEDKGSSIGGQGRDEPLEISLVEGSATVEVVDLGDNSFEIRARAAPYHPVAALRSLARSAWHLLPADVKAKNASFLQWTTTSPSGCPTRYIDVFIPGPGLKHTTFAVWKRRCGSGPALMFMLALGNLVLIVPSQEDQTTPLLLPPLPKSPYGEPRVLLVTLRKDEQVSPTIKTTVKYLSRHLVAVAKPEAVSVTVKTALLTVTIDCEIEIMPSESPNVVSYFLQGGDLRGELEVTGEPLQLLENGSLSGGIFGTIYGIPENSTGGDPEKTYAFACAMVSGAELTMKLKDGRTVASQITLLPVADFDSAALRSALELPAL